MYVSYTCVVFIMKTSYVIAILVVCFAIVMADDAKRKDISGEKELNEEINKMLTKDEPLQKGISKRDECKNKWYSFACEAVKGLGRCETKYGKEKCAEACGHCKACDDIFSKAKCLHLKETDKCYTEEARTNCGTTCESCGKACKNYIKQCGDKEILEELCTIASGGFMLCPRGCNLCVDRD